MWIVLDSLLDSWESERNVLAKKASDLDYNEIVIKLNEELESQIQNGIRQPSKSMNAFPWMNKMSGTLKMRELVERELSIQSNNE